MTDTMDKWFEQRKRLYEIERRAAATSSTNATKDAEMLVAWLREAADELEKAHAILDEASVPRIRSESGNPMTLAARILTLLEATR